MSSPPPSGYGPPPSSLIWVVAEVVVIVFCFVGGASAWFEAQGYAADRTELQH
jgi:hypothetical protein